MALVQRFTNTGILQSPGTFDEISLLARDTPNSATAVYPSTASGTGLTYSGTPGTFTWTCPAGVTSVTVLCVGGGGAGGYGAGSGGGGGGVGYKQITVVPGLTYTVVAGAGGAQNTTGSVNSGGDSYFISASTVRGGGGVGGLSNSPLPSTGGGAGGTFTGDGGGVGGVGGAHIDVYMSGAGGGAGGYSGNGGAGAAGAYDVASAGGNPAAGSGGAGGGSNGIDHPYGYGYAAGGGGVGLLGLTTDGSGGAASPGSITTGNGGIGGSGGTNGGIATGAISPYGGLTGTGRGGVGGAYGGGGGGGISGGGAGGAGAVKINWGQSNYGLTDQRLFPDGTFQSYAQFDEISLSPNSVQFNGTTQYLSIPNNTAFQFGSGDFTVEGWFYHNSYGTGQAIYHKRTTGYNSIGIDTNNSTPGYLMILVADAAGTSWLVLNDTTPYNAATWYHFALTKTANTVRFFLNGVLKVSASHTTSIADDGAPVTIGATASGGGALWNGYLSNIRVIKGTALYTSNFTVPGRTLTAVSGTSLLTCHATTIIDGGTANGGLPFTITNVGGAVVSKVAASSGTTVRKQTATSYQVYDSFDELSLAYTITPDKTIANEGDTVTYTVSALSTVGTSNPNLLQLATASYPTNTSGVNMTNTSTGTFNWTCPAGVTVVGVVCVGGGGGAGNNGGSGGGGGALAYINNYAVTPGNVYSVVTGAGGGFNGTGGTSYFVSTGVCAAGGGTGGGNGGLNPGTGGGVIAGTGFAGGSGGQGQNGSVGGGGGGGAGGYTAVGGNGGSTTGIYPSNYGLPGTVSTGGGGGGGAGATYPTTDTASGGGGGGVGLYGLGPNGLGGSGIIRSGITSGIYTAGAPGLGGSFGGNGYSSSIIDGFGGNYGGGAGGTGGGTGGVPATGGPGAVSILWGTNLISNGINNTYSEPTLYWTNSGTMAAADFTGGLVYGVTPLTWAGTATATLWSFTGITQLSTSGFGTGAVFSIRKNNATTAMGTFGVLTVIPTSPGSGYTIGDTIVIDGASLGLTTTTNNLTITVGSDWFAQLVNPATVTGTGLSGAAAGTATWTVPDGVYRVSFVCVGGGGGGAQAASAQGGGGGALAYAVDQAVIPGQIYTITAGAGGVGTSGGTAGGDSSWAGYVIAGGGFGGGTGSAGGYPSLQTTGTFGFSGGAGGVPASSTALGLGGGGGAGGYSSNGGAGGYPNSSNFVITGGTSIGGGGGGGSSGGGAGTLDSVGNPVNTSTGNGGGGGGTLLLGSSNIGIGGVNLAGSTGAILGQGGFGGSGGSTGGTATATVGGAGAIYGGGGGGGSTTGGAGGAGAARFIWNYPHGFLPDQTALTAVTNTILLTAQAATPVDASTVNNRISDVFGASINTTIKPFSGTYSYHFNGTTQYLTVPHSSNFVFGNGVDFTIEGWVYTSATTVNKAAFSKRASSGFSGVQFGTSNATASRFQILVANATGTAWTVNDSTVTFVINTWYHFAITKTNGNIYFYINGVLRLTVAHTTAIYDDGTDIQIGRDINASFWVGYLSNFRVVNGTALYSPTLYPSGFTPSTVPLTAVTNTKLLTLQSGGIFDNSGINNIISVPTLAGGNSIIPFVSTYSYQFNGTSQFLAIQSSSNFIFGSGVDFTIEGYLYTSATTINKGLYYKRASTGISSIAFGTSTTTVSRFTLKVANATGSAWTINDETAGTFAINIWYHFAITKTNGVIYLYLNGLLTRQYAHTTAIYDDGSVLNIGRDPGGSFWVGYLSNIRVIKGTALYYPPSTIVNRNYPDYPPVTTNSGSVTMSNGTGTITLPIAQDILQEGVQDIRLQLRSGSTSGTILATAPTVVVADTSRPLAIPGGSQCWCAYPDYFSGSNLVYTGTPGSFTFTAPKGYTTVSVVCIGGGGGGGGNGGSGGGGGALAYIASTAVTAGTTYAVVCGAGGTSATAGGASSFASTVIANGGSGGSGPSGAGGAGGTVGAGTGFAGGAGGTVSAGGGSYAGGGGGGAGGYTVAGGAGGAVTGTWPTLTAASGVASATGGAGGGAGGSSTAGAYFAAGGGGGGTSPFGSVAVASIAGIAYAGTGSSAGRGGGGSGGNPTTTAFGVQLGEKGYTAPGLNVYGQLPDGGRFGGGGGGGDGNISNSGNGGVGCVRIIWGTGRAYPATLTADRVSGYPAAVGNPAGQQ